ncbi:MAG: coproporphyrinogen-III oxidase family protein [bacterium]
MHAVPKINGLYVHVPFCDGKCHYCAFYSVPYARELGEAWLTAITRERDQALARYGTLSLTSIFMGGGTPSMLPPDQMERLLTLLRPEREQVLSWQVAELLSESPKACLSTHSTTQQLNNPATTTPPRGLEWTSEANPGSLTRDTLKMMKAFGVNRISLGVQAFSDPVLHQLGRRHSVADVYAAVESIHAVGFSNWGLDLIACIPGVSEKAWRETLESALRMAPKHISVYALTREEGTRLHQDCAAGTFALLDDDEQLRMLDEAEAILGEAGLGRYEISNYARPGFECRHNLSCWRGGNYLGLGCAAASRVGDQRWTNGSDVHAYIEGTNQQERETLAPVTDAVERLVFGLRMAEGIDLQAILLTSGMEQTDQAAVWCRSLERLGRDQLVEQVAGRWRLTSRGRTLADHVAVELMP